MTRKDYLKGLIVSRGYTMKQLANEMGLTKDTLYREVALSNKATPKHLYGIIEKLKLTDEELNTLMR